MLFMPDINTRKMSANEKMLPDLQDWLKYHQAYDTEVLIASKPSSLYNQLTTEHNQLTNSYAPCH